MNFIIFVFALLVAVTSDCHASGTRTGMLDYFAAFNGRTTPIAGQFDGTVGYALPLWSDSAQGTPWFGYVRPWISLRGPAQPTGLINLDIFPVSFFGLTIGRMYIQRWVDQPGMDCVQAKCKGSLNQTFIRPRLQGKFGGLYGALSYEKTLYDDHSGSLGPIAQGNNVVFLAPKNEQGAEWFLVAGYDHTEHWGGGITLQQFKSRRLAQEQESQMFYVRYKKDQWTYAVAAGRFQSTQFHAAPEFSASITWMGDRGLLP